MIVSFVNGFGPGLTPASTFDLVVADGGVTSALDGTRLPVTNADGGETRQYRQTSRLLRAVKYFAARAARPVDATESPVDALNRRLEGMLADERARRAGARRRQGQEEEEGGGPGRLGQRVRVELGFFGSSSAPETHEGPDGAARRGQGDA